MIMAIVMMRRRITDRGGYWGNILIKQSRLGSFQSTRSHDLLIVERDVIDDDYWYNSVLAHHVDMCKRYRTGLLR